jgi:hypothetical protein
MTLKYNSESGFGFKIMALLTIKDLLNLKCQNRVLVEKATLSFSSVITH